MENRFKPKPSETPVAATPPGVPPVLPVAKTILGRPATSFSPAEQSLIDEQLGRFCDILKKDPGSKIFVDEIIVTDIEIQRGDRTAADWLESEPNYDKRVKAWETRRDKLMDRHIAALKAIGAMPGDQIDEESDALADVYMRYTKEVQARRHRNAPIGQLSADAVALAKDKGMTPERYGSQAMPEEARAEVVAEMEKQGGQ